MQDAVAAELVTTLPDLPRSVEPRRLGTLAPETAYLASLGQRSQETMRSSLRVVAAAAGYQSGEEVPWWHWRYEHSAALRAWLVERGYAPATCNRHLSALRGTLEACWSLGLMTRDSYERACRVPPVRGSRLPPGRSLQPAELTRLFAACDTATAGGAQRAALVALMAGGGLRLAEPCGLDLAHYDPRAGALRVIGKGNKERLVPLPDGARRALSAWLAFRGLDPGPLLCPVRRGGRVVLRRMTPRAAAMALRELATRAEVPAVRTHDFRRTFGTGLLGQNVDLITVAKLLGHASLDTTRKYDRRGEAELYAATRRVHVPFHE